MNFKIRLLKILGKTYIHGHFRVANVYYDQS